MIFVNNLLSFAESKLLTQHTSEHEELKGKRPFDYYRSDLEMKNVFNLFDTLNAKSRDQLNI